VSIADSIFSSVTRRHGRERTAESLGRLPSLQKTPKFIGWRASCGPKLRRRIQTARKRASARRLIWRARGEKSLQLRAATSLAQLWRSQGMHGEARTVLAPVYGSFSEGFDLRGLRQARVLLDQLAATSHKS
jgi:hypothetical protein